MPSEVALQKNDATGDAPLPPHRELGAFYTGSKEPFVRRIFDEGAADYDRLEMLLSFGSGRWYRRQALLRAGLGPGMRVADVATGTGLVAREAVRLTGEGGLVVGIDPSAGMIAQAGDIRGLHRVRGTGEALPLAEGAFDMVSMGFALRHVEDLRVLFGTFLHVLRPGGRVCVLELTRSRSRLKNMAMRAYMRHVVPSFARLTGRRASRRMYRYYWETIDECVPPEKVLQALTDAGFTDADRHTELGIFSEYTATRP